MRPSAIENRRRRWVPLVLACALLPLALPSSALAGGEPPDAGEPPEGVARIHYARDDGDYAGWELHVWEDTLDEVTWAQGLPIAGFDDDGAYWDVRLRDGAQRVGFIVHKGDLKDPGPDMFLLPSQHGRRIWLQSGSDRIRTSRPVPPPEAGIARLHLHRPDGVYDGWTLHVWEDTMERVTWQDGLEPAGVTDYGAYWDVRLVDGARRLGFIVHRGDDKDPGPDMFLEIEGDRAEAWLISGSTTIHGARPDVRAAGGGDLRSARAHWLARDLLVWDTGVAVPGQRFTLHASPDATLALADGDVAGGEAVELLPSDEPLPAVLAERFPHLVGARILRLELPRERVADLLRGQLAVAMHLDGALVDATGVQLPGVLDDLYATDAPLGPTWAGGVPTISVWAPTARRVRLLLWDDRAVATAGEPRALPMVRDERSGVWSAVGDADWAGRPYLFEVEVFAPSTGRIETNRVTDPYSVALTTNSARSLLVDLRDPALAPAGWEALRKPGPEDPVDIVIYELHVRDFSAADPSVPEELVGTYRAFALPDTYGTRHLRRLAEAGLTHLHLLPTFDIATIDEDRRGWLRPEIDVAPPTASPAPQEAIEAVRDHDAFNWGYDPFHFNVPEGSYATDPDGPERTLEFREMVQALHELGLRVVVDVVYNHTHAAGQSERSVFDRIVPGYYHRLDGAGNVTTSTCCPNTATEHAMMERFVVDSVLLWAEAYKVDGFRFDLMGHHMVPNMLRVREALDGLSLEEHGVDGPRVYVYGEGWDFGEVAGGARGPNATQRNLAGTGIGTFDDRLRDAVRGGGPFDGGLDILANQGFASGLGVLANAVTGRNARDAELARARHAADLVRLGLGGMLADLTFEGAAGGTVRGDELDYNGGPAGYGRVPQDHVAYVSKHDNETLWDVLQYKLPTDLATEARVRLQLVALATVVFSQGVPFFHAGSDILRSKSFDRNSYDSGDPFNAIDWTMTSNGMGRGLPRAADNRQNWQLARERLVDPRTSPSPEQIAFAHDVFLEFLAIRRDSPLLRLRTAEDVHARLRFHATGPDAPPGVVVLEVRDDVDGLPALDPDHRRMVVALNATPARARVQLADVDGIPFLLHPVQAGGVDADALRSASLTGGGTLTVPPFSAVVLVAPRLR